VDVPFGEASMFGLCVIPLESHPYVSDRRDGFGSKWQSREWLARTERSLGARLFKEAGSREFGGCESLQAVERRIMCELS
jgi:hypothetical protein